MAEELVEFQQALDNSHFLQTTFCLKIKELIALSHSIDDAVARSQATQEDCNTLKTELTNLTTLRKEFETIRKTFHARFALNHSKEAAAANQSAAESLNESFNIQVNAEILVRRIGSQLSEEDNDYKVELELIEEAEDGNSEESESEQPDQTGKDQEHPSGEEEEEEVPRRMVPLVVLVFICLFVVLGFYLCLGVIIQFVEGNRSNNQNGRVQVSRI